MTNLVILDGIGYIRTVTSLVSATPAEYVAEIERLQRDLAAAKLLLDERIALAHPLTDEPSECPWCASREQHTDPRGTCARCHIPWRREDFLPGVDDKALDELKARQAVEPER